MAASPITLYRIDGVALASGKQAYGSPEMAVWLSLFVRYMAEVHKIRITVIKVADTAATAMSATTHMGGFAVDIRTWSLTAAQRRALIREGTRLGMPGHLRTQAQGFDPHCHAMLDVGRATPCSYQIVATRDGRDGLARGGPDLDRGLRPPQPWMGWRAGVMTMARELMPKAAPKPTPKPAPATVKPSPIPRHITGKPWMVIPESGAASGTFWSRVQWQLQIKPTGRLDHYTVRALKVWLGGAAADDGTGILRTIDVQRLQYRTGAPRTGKWDTATVAAFQKFLNRNR